MKGSCCWDKQEAGGAAQLLCKQSPVPARPLTGQGETCPGGVRLSRCRDPEAGAGRHLEPLSATSRKHTFTTGTEGRAPCGATGSDAPTTGPQQSGGLRKPGSSQGDRTHWGWGSGSLVPAVELLRKTRARVSASPSLGQTLQILGQGDGRRGERRGERGGGQGRREGPIPPHEKWPKSWGGVEGRKGCPRPLASSHRDSTVEPKWDRAPPLKQAGAHEAPTTYPLGPASRRPESLGGDRSWGVGGSAARPTPRGRQHVLLMARLLLKSTVSWEKMPYICGHLERRPLSRCRSKRGCGDNHCGPTEAPSRTGPRSDTVAWPGWYPVLFLGLLDHGCVKGLGMHPR